MALAGPCLIEARESKPYTTQATRCKVQGLRLVQGRATTTIINNNYNNCYYNNKKKKQKKKKKKKTKTKTNSN